MLSRRETLERAARLAGGAALAPVLNSLPASLAATAATPKAAPSGLIPYGAAVRPDALAGDADYRAALAADCTIIVPEGDLIWAVVRPTRDTFNFAPADAIADFATAHQLDMRGHALDWYGAMPAWTEEIATPAEAERELVGHIEKVVARYRGRISSWNVINEPIPDNPATVNDIRPSIWQRRMGNRHMAIALKTTHAADPKAQLVINEYDIEFVGDRYRRRREAFSHLIHQLVDAGAPLHGVGIQGHLKGELDIDADGLGAFVASMRKLGLDVLVTELDVIDNALPGPIELRDAAVAARAREFLAAIYAVARPTTLMTWGLTDKYTWVPIYFTRRDGLPNRPLPLDEVYAAKPLMAVLQDFRRQTV